MLPFATALLTYKATRSCCSLTSLFTCSLTLIAPVSRFDLLQCCSITTSSLLTPAIFCLRSVELTCSVSGWIPETTLARRARICGAKLVGGSKQGGEGRGETVRGGPGVPGAGDLGGVGAWLGCP